MERVLSDPSMRHGLEELVRRDLEPRGPPGPAGVWATRRAARPLEGPTIASGRIEPREPATPAPHSPDDNRVVGAYTWST